MSEVNLVKYKELQGNYTVAINLSFITILCNKMAYFGFT